VPMIAAIYARKSTDPGGVGEESSVDFKPYVDLFAVLLTPTFGITTAGSPSSSIAWRRNG
jgi:hypothetical protein